MALGHPQGEIRCADYCYIEQHHEARITRTLNMVWQRYVEASAMPMPSCSRMLIENKARQRAFSMNKLGAYCQACKRSSLLQGQRLPLFAFIPDKTGLNFKMKTRLSIAPQFVIKDKNLPKKIPIVMNQILLAGNDIAVSCMLCGF